MTLRAMRYEIGFSSNGLALQRLGATGRPVCKREGYHDRGRWAPYHGPKVCKSKAGRWRAEHCYDADDICVFCNQERVGTWHARH